MRINKYLSRCGLGSRRKVEELIVSGRVEVDGVKTIDLATDIDPGRTIVQLDGHRVKLIEEKIYLLLNKPKGYIVTRKDELDRKTVFSLIPEQWSHLFPVGRLDKDTEGLLLLTNDGYFAQKIIHPRNAIEKVYRVDINGHLRKNELKSLREGVKIDSGPTQPARIFVKATYEDRTVLRMIITEGKNRQIRKMFAKFGYQVISLKRLQVANIKLDKLPVGMFRVLRPAEIRKVLEL